MLLTFALFSCCHSLSLTPSSDHSFPFFLSLSAFRRSFVFTNFLNYSIFVIELCIGRIPGLDSQTLSLSLSLFLSRIILISIKFIKSRFFFFLLVKNLMLDLVLDLRKHFLPSFFFSFVFPPSYIFPVGSFFFSPFDEVILKFLCFIFIIQLSLEFQASQFLTKFIGFNLGARWLLGGRTPGALER